MLLSGLLEAVPHTETLREYYEEDHKFLIMFRSSKRQLILGKNWANFIQNWIWFLFIRSSTYKMNDCFIFIVVNSHVIFLFPISVS